MQKAYKAPELKLVGPAGQVVMGSAINGDDYPWKTAPDFEFEHDSL